MFLQSILVYSILMSVMILYGISASNKYVSYLNSNGLIKQPSFWHFNVIIPLLLFAIIFGMRYDVGVDHLSYLDIYLYKIRSDRTEYLFSLLSELGWLFNLHYTVYFGLIAFIQALLFFYAFKNERYLFPFLVFFLFTDGAVFFWMNGIRQALAMCVWIYSIKYIEEKKPLHYLAWGVVSFLFHRSAIILFAFYPILRNGKDYLKTIPIQLILFGSAFIVREIFSSIIMQIEGVVNFYISLIGREMYERSYNIDGLMDSFIEQKGTGLAFLFKIIVHIVIILYSKRLKAFYTGARFPMIYFFFFLGLITSYIFPGGFISFTRPFRYFYVFQPIMYAFFAYFLYRTRRNITNYIVLLALIIAFIGIFFLSQFYANEFSHSLYQFYFQHNINGYPR